MKLFLSSVRFWPFRGLLLPLNTPSEPHDVMSNACFYPISADTRKPENISTITPKLASLPSI